MDFFSHPAFTEYGVASLLFFAAVLFFMYHQREIASIRKGYIDAISETRKYHAEEIKQMREQYADLVEQFIAINQKTVAAMEGMKLSLEVIGGLEKMEERFTKYMIRD